VVLPVAAGVWANTGELRISRQPRRETFCFMLIRRLKK
jgi:hypothetical protein